MDRWKAILSLLCLVMWVSATQHCQLENLPGLGFLHCAGDTSGKSDCQGDACDVVERGAYKAPDHADASIVPLVVAVLIYTVPATECTVPELCNLAVTSATLPRRRAESWQSFSALALPIRGPSLHS